MTYFDLYLLAHALICLHLCLQLLLLYHLDDFSLYHELINEYPEMKHMAIEIICVCILGPILNLYFFVDILMINVDFIGRLNQLRSAKNSNNESGHMIQTYRMPSQI